MSVNDFPSYSPVQVIGLPTCQSVSTSRPEHERRDGLGVGQGTPDLLGRGRDLGLRMGDVVCHVILRSSYDLPSPVPGIGLFTPPARAGGGQGALARFEKWLPVKASSTGCSTGRSCPATRGSATTCAGVGGRRSPTTRSTGGRILVTGGTSGLGLATVEACARLGADRAPARPRPAARRVGGPRRTPAGAERRRSSSRSATSGPCRRSRRSRPSSRRACPRSTGSSTTPG